MSPIKVLLLLSFVLPLLSQQITVDFVVSDGDWYDPANWSPQIVPSDNSTAIFIVTVPNGIRLTLPQSPFFHTLYCTGCQLTVGDAVINGSLILDNLSVLFVDGSVTGSGQVSGGDITLTSEGSYLGLPLQDASGITFDTPLAFIEKVSSSVPIEISGFWNESFPTIGEFYLSADVGKDSTPKRSLTVEHFYWSGSTYYDNLLVTGNSGFNAGPYFVFGRVDFGSNPNTTLLWVGGSISLAGSGGIYLTSVGCSGNNSCSFLSLNNSLGVVALTAGGFIDATNKGGDDAGIVTFEGCSVTSEGRWVASAVRLQYSVFTVKRGSYFDNTTNVYATMKTSVIIKDNVQVPNLLSDYLLFVAGDQQAEFQSLTARGVVEGRSILVRSGLFGEVIINSFMYVDGSLSLDDALHLTDTVMVMTNNAELSNVGNVSFYLTNSKLRNNGTWKVSDDTLVYLDGNSTLQNENELIFSGGNFEVKSYKNETGSFYNFGVFHANHTGSTFRFEDVPFYQCSNGILRIGSRGGVLPRFFLSTQAVIWGKWDFLFDTKQDYDLIPDTGFPYAFTPTRVNGYGDRVPVLGSFHQNTYIGGVSQPMYGANCEDITTRDSVFSYYKLEDIPFYDVDKCAGFDPDVPQDAYIGCGRFSSANRPLISFFLLLVLSLVLL